MIEGGDTPERGDPVLVTDRGRTVDTPPSDDPLKKLAAGELADQVNIRTVAFYSSFDNALGNCDATDQRRFDLIPLEVRRQHQALANAVDVYFATIDGASTEGIIVHLKEKYGITMLGREENKQGFFIRLYKLPGKEGRKPGGLFFSVIPPKHRAPIHVHHGEHAAEVTSTHHGILRYLAGGKIVEHGKNDNPRVSPNGSADIYLTQAESNGWVGFYVQEEGCDVVGLHDMEQHAVKAIAGEIGAAIGSAVSETFDRMPGTDERISTKQVAPVLDRLLGVVEELGTV